MLTAQILQDEVQLSPGLEGIDEVHDERMLHLLQDVPLGFSVSGVLRITHNHGLARDRAAHSESGCETVKNYLRPISGCQSFIGRRCRATAKSHLANKYSYYP